MQGMSGSGAHPDYSGSLRLYQEAVEVLPGGVNSASRLVQPAGAPDAAHTIYVVEGDGCRVVDLDGRQYVDFHMCAGGALFGHRYDAVSEAMALQLRRGVCFSASNPLEVEVGALIKAFFPTVERVRFCNSGSEAIAAALGLARVFAGRPGIITFEGCYHGWLCSEAGPYDRRLALDDLESVARCLESNASDVAAILIDPCPASNGLISIDSGFLKELRRLCDRYSVLLVFDEIITGMRLAAGGAQERFGIAADLTVLGKVLSGGMPLSAYGGRSDVMNAASPIGRHRQGGTFSGHPLALAAACAILRDLEAYKPYTQLETKARRLASGINTATRAANIPAHMVQVGSIATLYQGSSFPGSASARQAAALPCYDIFHRNLLDEGIYLAPGASKSWFISTRHEEADIDFAIASVVRAIRSAYGVQVDVV
jgi:glutamate-1-semialdehyde 2,1-aminomutase